MSRHAFLKRKELILKPVRGAEKGCSQLPGVIFLQIHECLKMT